MTCSVSAFTQQRMKLEAVFFELWNRLLVIVYTDEDLPLYRTIMAFDAEGRLHDEYYQR